jgi:predicted fused transcriptional regulator/phosphomethylpyrimidine kinase
MHKHNKTKKSKLNSIKLMTKTTKNIKFSTYHVNICTDMGYMFMMTKKKQSVKQININKNVLNDYQIYWK